MKKIILLFVIMLGMTVLLCSCDCKHKNLSPATCTDPSICSDCGETISAAIGHTDGQWITDKEANCTEDGSKHQVCAVCEATIKTETLTKLGHTDGQWITDKEANCTEDGSKHQVCSVCEATIKTETVTKLGHIDVVDEAIAATCTDDGKTEGKHCSRCNETLVAQTAIGKLDHIEVIDVAVAATCTTDGKTEGKHCSVCNTVTIAQTIINAKGHTEVTDKAVAATCTTDGKTEGKHCSVCNTVTVSQTTINAKGHSYVNDICENCNTLIDKQGAIEAENKRHSDFVASCQEGINVHSQEASRLKQAYGFATVSNDAAYYRGLQKEIDTNITNITNNINHYKGLESLYGTDYSSMIATFESNLRKEKERKTLNERYLAIAIQQDEVESYRNKLAEEDVRHAENLRLINARYYCIENGHTNIVIDQARPATCGQVGLSQGSHCVDCNTIIQEQIVSPITGHNYDSDNKCIFCSSSKPSDGLRYTLRSDGISYSVSIGSCTDRVVVIADTYNGLPVVEIAEKAFYKSIILSIVIPENVTIVGDYAFFRCESLKEIILPSTLENIGNMAFYYCALLKNVTYNGTVDQWNSITKVSGWDSGMGNTPLKKYAVYCTDETLIV